MITEKELLEAIAECQGQRNPNANTCIKLASFYTILDHMNQDEPDRDFPQYSFAGEGPNVIAYKSDTKFAEVIYGKDTEEVLEVMDELMTTLSVVNPPLYKSVIRRVSE